MPDIISANKVAEIAALVGDAARANILLALMGGRALTAGELAWHAGVSAQTTSGHLAKLTGSGMLAVERQGRHRYFRLATAEIARVLETLMAAADASPRRPLATGPRDEAMRIARTCYDHMAGRLGVAVADALCARGHVVLADGAGLVTDAGRKFFQKFGIDIERESPTRRPLCRTCLDWSERRPHLAGRLGAALLDRALALEWLKREAHGRTLRVTKFGARELVATFGLPPDWPGGAAR